MKHTMGLYKTYFDHIKEGKKTVEVRLFDQKRRKIEVGHIIEFIKLPEQNDSLTVEVTKLRNFDTFKQLYETIPFEDLGGEGWTLDEMLKGTYEIYTPEQEKKWGVLAIKLRYLK
ncbi:ASCH domain-containing protein [Halobacillus sp. MO56]